MSTPSMSGPAIGPAPGAESRAAWDALAPAFDDVVTPATVRHGAAALNRLDIGPRTRVLDVAAGSGALSLPAARRGATVVASDIAPTMIERLTSRARAEGLRIEGRTDDAESLDLPDDTFDIVMTQNGVTMLPDARPALAEMVRVARPGGTVLVIAFGPLPKAEFLTVFLAAVRVAVPGFAGIPTDPPPPPFQFADPHVFGARLSDAGLTDVTMDTITWDMPMGSAIDLWTFVGASNPIGAGLAGTLTDAQRDEVVRVVDGVFRERSGAGPGTTLHAEVNVGIGTKP